MVSASRHRTATNQAIRPTWATHGRQSGLSPLECAGAALVVGSYLFEWTFRGYMDYQYLRTLNMRFMVPWYDVIPQIGAVLWWRAGGPKRGRRSFSIARGEADGNP